MVWVFLCYVISKIVDKGDFFKVMMMGFCGEVLFSIVLVVDVLLIMVIGGVVGS